MPVEVAPGRKALDCTAWMIAAERCTGISVLALLRGVTIHFVYVCDIASSYMNQLACLLLF